MIPTLQLDPSTLALWFNVELLNSYKGEERGFEVFTHAANQDLGEIYPILDGAASDSHRSHYYEIISAIWHEKRHFVDYLLTNFGAFQVRTYFQLYFNIPIALKEFQHQDIPLLLPLDSYTDRTKLMVHGVKEPSAELLKLARWLQARKRALENDTTLHDGGRGPTEHGGIAQMEAIAYSCQLAILQYEFGTDAIELLNRYSPLPSLQNRRYSWARDFWCDLPPHPDFPVFATIVNMDVMLAIMVASLCGRIFTPAGELGSPHERTAPSWRFLKLYTSERWEQYSGSSSEEIWSRVNAKAKELWGFTIEEELRQDWEIESQLLREFKTIAADSGVVRAFEKYHAARKIVIDDFIASPTQYTSTAGYLSLLNDGVSPLQVICAPSGQEWNWSADALFDYDFSHLGRHRALKGWHAVVNPHYRNDSSSKISLGFDEDWKSILTEFSPITKLMVSGRTQRLMLGAELDKGERLLKKVGFKTIFIPPHNRPNEHINAKEYRHLTGREGLVCDFTGQKLSGDTDLDFISPWDIKNAEAFDDFFKYIAERMNSQEVAGLTLAKDWSHWVTSKTIAKEIRSRFGMTS